MKLLFDENLSPKLPRILSVDFPKSMHVRDDGFTAVSKNSNFYQRNLIYGHPLKLVWLRISNFNHDILVSLITKYKEQIYLLDSNPSESILVILS